MSEEKQNAGLPVSPSVTPEGSQGTGSREAVVEFLAVKTNQFIDRWAPKHPKLRRSFMAELRVLTALWGDCSHGYIEDLLRLAGEDAPAIQSPTPQQESKKGTEGGQ